MKNKDKEIQRLILESIRNHENHINFHKKECEKYRKAYNYLKHIINKGKTTNLDAFARVRVVAGKEKSLITNELPNNEINNSNKRKQISNTKNVKLLKGTTIQWKKLIIDYLKKQPKFKSLDQIISDLFPFKNKEAQEVLKHRCYDVLFKYEKSGIINSRIIENKKHYSILRKTSILYQ